MQSEAQIANVIHNWSRQAKLLPGWKWPNGDLKDVVEGDLRQIIREKYKNEFTFSTLDLAVSAKIVAREHARAEREQTQKQQEKLLALVAEFGKAAEAQYPALDAEASQNANRVLQLFQANSNLVVADILADVYWHPDLWRWTDGVHNVDFPTLLRKYPLAQLEQVYGAETVAKAFAEMRKSIHKYSEAARPSWLGDTTAKKEADAEVALRGRERDPKEIAKAIAACEALVDRFSAGSNHAETSRGKKQLAQIVVKTDGVFDAFRTREAREAWIRDYVSEAERKH